MKLLLLALSLFPALAMADTEVNMLAGTYSSCVQWTTMGGVETSKKFELLFTPENTLHLTAAFYVGSASCQGDPRDERRYDNLASLSDSGNRPFRKITVQAQETGMYFEFVLTMHTAVIYTGDSVPVQHDAMRMMILDRVQ
jgi:hypothetical protein